jgi:hypothetical protein
MAQEDAGYEFVPLAVESYGRLVGAASSFLSSLDDIAVADGRVSKAAFMRSARAELSYLQLQRPKCAGGAQLQAMSRQRAHALCVHVRDRAGSGSDVHAWLFGAGGGCWVCLK